MIWKLVVTEQGLLDLQMHLLSNANLIKAESFGEIVELRICVAERMGLAIQGEGSTVKIARLLRSDNHSRGSHSSQIVHTVVLEVCDALLGRHTGYGWGEEQVPLQIPSGAIASLWEVASQASR